jgi:hypothetical protein
LAHKVLNTASATACEEVDAWIDHPDVPDFSIVERSFRVADDMVVSALVEQRSEVA